MGARLERRRVALLLRLQTLLTSVGEAYVCEALEMIQRLQEQYAHLAVSRVVSIPWHPRGEAIHTGVERSWSNNSTVVSRTISWGWNSPKASCVRPPVGITIARSYTTLSR